MGYTRETFKDAIDTVMNLSIDNLARDGWLAETVTGFTRDANPVASILAGTRIRRDHARARLGDGAFVTTAPLQKTPRSLLRAHLALRRAEVVIYVTHQTLPDVMGAVPGIIVMGAWPQEWLTYTRVAFTDPEDTGNTELLGEPVDARFIPGLLGVEEWLVDLVPDVRIDTPSGSALY